jgi:parvulin-like peptidyl-prolyl isomerase
MINKILQSTVLSIALIACGDEETTTETKSPLVTVKGDVVATVEGTPIGSEDFATLAARKAPANGEELSLEQRKEIVDDLVIEELLYQEALTQGYDQDPKVKKVMVNALIRKEIYDSVKNSDFSDAELEAYYTEHIEEFTVPAKVQIYNILIKVTDDRSDEDAKAKAERLHAQIKKDPTTFRDVAKEESESPYKRRGGDIGYVPLTGKPGLDQEVVDKAFEMRVETLAAPFKTKSGWNIVYVPAKREAKDRSFTQMKGSVLRKVKNEKVKEMYDNYTVKIRSGKSVTIDDAALQNVTVQSGKRPTLEMPNGMQMGGE